MTRRFGMEIEGRWHLFARSAVEIHWPSVKTVPLQIFVADRSPGAEDLSFAVVQTPRKLRTFAEGLRGDRKFLKEIPSSRKPEYVTSMRSASATIPTSARSSR